MPAVAQLRMARRALSVRWAALAIRTSAERIEAPVGPGQDRVELHQGDLRMVVLEPGEPRRQFLQGGDVHGRQPLVAEEFPRGARGRG